MNSFLKLAATVLAIALIVIVLWPVSSDRGYGSRNKNQLLSNVKQVSVSLLIYSADYDNILPDVYTRPDLEAVINPYLKNPALLKPIKDFSTAPSFNYNLAAVNIFKDIEVIGKKQPLPPAEVPMIYALITDQNSNSPAMVGYADTHVKPIPSGKPFSPADLFVIQFPRETREK